ncbi:hypothetical protein BDV33DRAFT_173647 [Aspergillus novoparasiticus]|uniref:Uncharacterized protein n=1 Tax=Aspergillus novoparasiticus TaxID=986946 RepID=A0A5N6ER99_9EURO|nr:hypothetical protein BDV33DRAFT_173647 [Aspergillus novoparasiticus]
MTWKWGRIAASWKSKRGLPFRPATIERTELVWDPRDAWRPVPLRAPYLLTLAGFLLLTAIALEVCRQYNDRIGWLVRYKDASDLPMTVSVAYVIVPTAIALVVVNLWEFSSCDVMRLEPYFQLAKSQSASSNSTFHKLQFLLRYPRAYNRRPQPSLDCALRVANVFGYPNALTLLICWDDSDG